VTQPERQTGLAPERSSDADGDRMRLLYGEVCRSYHAVTDFRAKLLGLLPITSGAGIFVLLGTDIASGIDDYLIPIGLFGCLVTIGLTLYETEGKPKKANLSA
jgi:hypothetical protein